MSVIDNLEIGDIVKVSLGVTLAGGSLALAGKSIQWCSRKVTVGESETVSTSKVKDLGKTLEKVGKTIAFTVLVPAYITLYKLPKWGVQELLPKSLKALDKYAITPLVNGATEIIRKISLIMKKLTGMGIRDCLEFAWDRIFVPACKLNFKIFLRVEKIVGSFLRNNIAPLLKFTYGKVQAVAQIIWEKIVKPTLLNVIEPILRHIVAPSIEFIYKNTRDAAQIIWEKIVKPIFKEVKRVGNKVFSHIIIPIARVTSQSILALMSKVHTYVISPALKGAVTLDKFCRKNLILPVFHLVERVSAEVVQQAQFFLVRSKAS